MTEPTEPRLEPRKSDLSRYFPRSAVQGMFALIGKGNARVVDVDESADHVRKDSTGWEIGYNEHWGPLDHLHRAGHQKFTTFVLSNEISKTLRDPFIARLASYMEDARVDRLTSDWFDQNVFGHHRDQVLGLLSDLPELLSMVQRIDPTAYGSKEVHASTVANLIGRVSFDLPLPALPPILQKFVNYFRDDIVKVRESGSPLDAAVLSARMAEFLEQIMPKRPPEDFKIPIPLSLDIEPIEPEDDSDGDSENENDSDSESDDENADERDAGQSNSEDSSESETDSDADSDERGGKDSPFYETSSPDENTDSEDSETSDMGDSDSQDTDDTSEDEDNEDSSGEGRDSEDAAENGDLDEDSDLESDSLDSPEANVSQDVLDQLERQAKAKIAQAIQQMGRNLAGDIDRDEVEIKRMREHPLDLGRVKIQQTSLGHEFVSYNVVQERTDYSTLRVKFDLEEERDVSLVRKSKSGLLTPDTWRVVTGKMDVFNKPPLKKGRLVVMVDCSSSMGCMCDQHNDPYWERMKAERGYVPLSYGHGDGVQSAWLAWQIVGAICQRFDDALVFAYSWNSNVPNSNTGKYQTITTISPILPGYKPTCVVGATENSGVLHGGTPDCVALEYLYDRLMGDVSGAFAIVISDGEPSAPHGSYGYGRDDREHTQQLATKLSQEGLKYASVMIRTRDLGIYPAEYRLQVDDIIGLDEVGPMIQDIARNL